MKQIKKQNKFKKKKAGWLIKQKAEVFPKSLLLFYDQDIKRILTSSNEIGIVEICLSNFGITYAI